MPTLVDITGRQFGKLIAKKRVFVTLPSGKEPRWLCSCECGGYIRERITRLLNGETENCGRRCRLFSGRAARNDILLGYKNNAKRDGRIWAITDELFDTLTSLPCHYCGQSPTNKASKREWNGDFIYNGLDRKDSSKGYLFDNVVPCCKFCQKAKSNTPYEQFIAFLLRAGKFQLEKSNG